MRYTIADIEAAVCVYFKLTRGDIRGQSRRRNIARPRQIAMYLCREWTTASYPRIGKYFGDRDHTTVIHAENRISELMIVKPKIAEYVIDCQNMIYPTIMAEMRSLALAPLVSPVHGSRFHFDGVENGGIS